LLEKRKRRRIEKHRDAIKYLPAFGHLGIINCVGYAMFDGPRCCAGAWIFGDSRR
jgi:hypothetical protein